MSRVVIAMDPHKRSATIEVMAPDGATIEVMAPDETVLGAGRKTEATDAHSVALVGTRMDALRSRP